MPSSRQLARGVRIGQVIEAEQHQAVRVEHVVEAQRLGIIPRTAPHRHAVQEHAQRSVEASCAAILDPAALVLEAIDPSPDPLISAPVRLQRLPTTRPMRMSIRMGGSSSAGGRFTSCAGCSTVKSPSKKRSPSTCGCTTQPTSC
jgi:hypothetical protein